jgi:hypothetical protein
MLEEIKQTIVLLSVGFASGFVGRILYARLKSAINNPGSCNQDCNQGRNCNCRGQ